MRRFLSLFLLTVLLTACRSAPPTVPVTPQAWPSATAFLSELDRAATDPARLDALWEKLVREQKIPFSLGDTTIFLWRGEAQAVSWHGDFDAWGRDYLTRGKGRRIGESDLWIHTRLLPHDARIDYKIVVDDEWMLDPNNPRIVYSGFGPNSEFPMPGYVYPEETQRRPDVPQGAMTSPRLIFSHVLGYEVRYQVYTPPGYETFSSNAPTLYVTDGHEYAHDALGALPVVLDNLLADEKIRPVVTVFIDPRDPDSLHINRREQEFLANPRYAAFVAEELVPEIERQYPVASTPDQRAILGTSFGGLNAAFFGALRPDVFGLLGIQSPAIWPKPAILEEYASQPRRPLKIFISSGSLNDGQTYARHLAHAMREKGYPLHYIEVNEGHSWGAWRGQLDEMLIFFFGR